MAKLTIGDMGEGRKVSSIYESSAVGAVAEMVAGNGEPETASAAAPPRWDVFKSRRRSSALVFQNNQMEQSE
jgi:type IV secretion system protein VirB1